MIIIIIVIIIMIMIIDLGEAGIIHGIQRHGQFQQLRSGSWGGRYYLYDS